MDYVQNSILNSLSFERVFRENQRFASSQAVAGVCSTTHVKFILGVGLKVKESIKNPFRWKFWLGSVHDRLRVRVKDMTTA
jgi:RNase P protein component